MLIILLWVELSGFLVDLGSNWDCAVDGVGDDSNDSIRTDLSRSLKILISDIFKKCMLKFQWS